MILEVNVSKITWPRRSNVVQTRKMRNVVERMTALESHHKLELKSRVKSATVFSTLAETSQDI